MRRMLHGMIMHGEQHLGPRRKEPTSYYGATSGVGQAILALQPSGPIRVGVVGLGVGTLAAYGRSGDVYRFYEINPQVIDAARKEFFFLSDSAAKIETVLGDARLAMEREAPQQYDVLVIDAFSSDAIPVHLITREAMGVYLRHLKPGGVLAIHITNRFLRLGPVVKRLADDQSLHAILIDDDAKGSDLATTDWVLLSRNCRACASGRTASTTCSRSSSSPDPSLKARPPQGLDLGAPPSARSSFLRGRRPRGA
jgi:SAM-dependent methyltransferase